MKFRIFLLFLLLPSVLPGQNTPPLLMGAEDSYPPFSYLDRDGRITGFAPDLARSIFEKMDRPYSIAVDSWAEVKTGLEEGKLDLLPLVGRTPEREHIFDFTFPYYRMSITMAVRKESPVPHSLTDLEKKNVAVMEGDNADEYLTSSGADLQIIRTPDFKEALMMLSRGEVDAVVIQRLLAYTLMDELELDNLEVSPEDLEGFTQSFCLAVREGNKELLAVLNEGLSLVISDGTYDRLLFEWFSPLGRHHSSSLVIQIGGDSNYPPYEYLDDEGNPAGYNVDLTRAIAKYMDLNVKIELRPWSETYRRLLDGDIHMVQGLFYTPERDLTMAFSQAHSSVSHVSFVRREDREINSFEELSGKKILLMRDDVTDNLLTQMGFGEHLIRVDTLSDIVIRLARGEGDCAVMAREPAVYLIRKYGISNLQEGDYSFFTPQYNYGALDKNNDYLNPFREGLSLLKSNGEYREIYSRWFGIGTGLEMMRSLAAQKAVQATLILLILSSVIFAAVLTARRILHRKNRMHAWESGLNGLAEKSSSLFWQLDIKGELAGGNRAFRDLWGIVPSKGNLSAAAPPLSGFFTFISLNHYNLIDIEALPESLDHRITIPGGEAVEARTELKITPAPSGGKTYICGMTIIHEEKMK